MGRRRAKSKPKRKWNEPWTFDDWREAVEFLSHFAHTVNENVADISNVIHHRMDKIEHRFAQSYRPSRRDKPRRGGKGSRR